jgi:hypothetical protein
MEGAQLMIDDNNGYPKIVELFPAGGETLIINFDLKGAETTWYSVRLTDLINRKSSLQKLRKDHHFYKVEREEWGGGAEWPELELGLGGDLLYSLAMTQNGVWKNVGSVSRWKVEENLTNAQMANILGVSERTIATYLAKPEDVPQMARMAIYAHRHINAAM